MTDQYDAMAAAIMNKPWDGPESLLGDIAAALRQAAAEATGPLQAEIVRLKGEVVEAAGIQEEIDGGVAAVMFKAARHKAESDALQAEVERLRAEVLGAGQRAGVLAASYAEMLHSAAAERDRLRQENHALVAERNRLRADLAAAVALLRQNREVYRRGLTGRCMVPYVDLERQAAAMDSFLTTQEAAK